jgi:hypothetical protein
MKTPPGSDAVFRCGGYLYYSLPEMSPFPVVAECLDSLGPDEKGSARIVRRIDLQMLPLFVTPFPLPGESFVGRAAKRSDAHRQGVLIRPRLNEQQ